MEFVPAIVAGLKDSVNPCALAVMLIFVLALLLLGKTQGLILNFGIYFLVTGFIVNMGILFGWTDFFLGSREAQEVLRLVQVPWGWVLICLGAVLVFDWVRVLFVEDEFAEAIPYPVKAEITKPFAALTGIASGAALILLHSIWPPDYNLLVLFYNVYIPEKFVTAAVSMGLYTIFLMLPMMVIFGLLVYASGRNVLVAAVEKHKSLIKIVMAGLFVSLGAGLIQIF